MAAPAPRLPPLNLHCTAQIRINDLADSRLVIKRSATARSAQRAPPMYPRRLWIVTLSLSLVRKSYNPGTNLRLRKDLICLACMRWGAGEG